MNKTICVYTCITGDYDNLHEIDKPEKTIDYYCFTNNKNIKSKTWKIVYISDDKLDNCRLARKTKTIGNDIINNYDIAVWTDADVIWEKPIMSFVKTFHNDSSLTIFKHHARNTVYDEAIACLRLRKDSKEKIVSTLNYLKESGFPDKNGLCESTVYIKNPKEESVKKTMATWFDVIQNHSRRDQLSFNYAAWKEKLSFNYIDLNVWDNEWFSTVKHNSKTDIVDCHVYYGNPDKDFIIDKYHSYSYKVTGDKYSFSTIIPFDTNTIEFNPSNILGTVYANLIVRPAPTKIETQGAIFNTFCNDHGVFYVSGHFKKGDRLFFSIQMNVLNEKSAYNKLVEKEWQEINRLNQTLVTIQNENQILKHKVSRIEKNIFYRALRKVKRVISARSLSR